MQSYVTIEYQLPASVICKYIVIGYKSFRMLYVSGSNHKENTPKINVNTYREKNQTLQMTFTTTVQIWKLVDID